MYTGEQITHSNSKGKNLDLPVFQIPRSSCSPCVRSFRLIHSSMYYNHEAIFLTFLYSVPPRIQDRHPKTNKHLAWPQTSVTVCAKCQVESSETEVFGSFPRKCVWPLWPVTLKMQVMTLQSWRILRGYGEATYHVSNRLLAKVFEILSQTGEFTQTVTARSRAEMDRETDGQCHNIP